MPRCRRAITAINRLLNWPPIYLTGANVIFDIVIPRSFGTETQIERPEVVAKFQAMLARQSPGVYSHICELAANTNAWSAFNSLRLPTLFVSGSEDVSTSPDIMRPLAEQVGGRFVEIPNAGITRPLSNQPTSRRRYSNTPTYTAVNR